MENSVIITFIVAGLVGWIAYLIYNYNMVASKYHNEYEFGELMRHYRALQCCVTDLITEINNKFPGSNLTYNGEGHDEVIEGEIKFLTNK